jgi:hypothetical protein
MRKFVFLIMSILIAFVAIGQQTDLRVSKLRSSLDAVLDLDKNQTYFYTYPTATVDTVDNTWSYTIGVDNSFDLTKQYVKVTLDSISGTPSVTTHLYGKTFWGDSWTSIANVVWAGSSADTTFYITNATAVAYRFFSVGLIADTTGNHVAKPSLIEFKLGK